MSKLRAFHPADALAGLSLAGLLLPEAVAYSGVANLPPQAGVIGLFAGLVCYALLGRSRFAVVTATSSSAAVFAAATLALGPNAAGQRLAFASILVCATGIAFLLAGCARLGAMSSLIARPVLRGFSFGLALVIAVKQWPHIVGMHTHSTGFLALVAEIFRNVGAWQWNVLIPFQYLPAPEDREEIAKDADDLCGPKPSHRLELEDFAEAHRSCCAAHRSTYFPMTPAIIPATGVRDTAVVHWSEFRPSTTT